MREIERKFLIKKLPDLGRITPVRYERYFLSDDGIRQVRIQKTGDKYELETKTKINAFEFEKSKKEISEGEFLELSSKCKKVI
ncbi:MAG: hypothetical protein LBU87_01455, partial [Lactobacillales bacterium]|nr:hypothetical protein [Lactobacillales bacterium]